MRWSVLLAEILLSLNTYRLRSLLTALGVIIGVCAVFLTLNISHYITNTLNRELTPISKTLIIYPRPIIIEGVSSFVKAASRLTSKDSDSIKILPFVQFAAPVMLVQNSQALSAFGNISTPVVCTGQDYFDISGLPVGSGNFFTKSDVDMGAKVAVIGTEIVHKLFPNQNPLGQNISIGNISFRVTGVIKKQGPSIDGKDRDTLVVIPLTTAKQRFFNDYNTTNAVDYILISVANSTFLYQNTDAIKNLLMKLHNNPSPEATDFSIQNREKEVNSVNFIFHSISFSLLLIGGVTLTVSGIGISTLMLMSISERKHEIGLKKAIGASDNQIMVQILLEAVAISVFGGIIGSILGIGVIYIFDHYTQITIINSYYYLIPCCGIAILLGIVSGIFPAYLTLRIQPINALNEQR